MTFFQENNQDPVIAGPRLSLFPLSERFFSDAYVAWLNDPEVQKFSRRRGRVTSADDAKTFIEYAKTCADHHLAIVLSENQKHIGNISLNSVDTVNQSAEISIMIGDKDEWGKGYATDAIALATEIGFTNLNLHRLWTESPNPAFAATMGKLGWKQEGVKREAMLIEEKFMDVICWSLLNEEWKGVNSPPTRGVRGGLRASY